MTIEELLNCDIAELEEMSDDELREHFKPYLAVTQPDPNVSVAKPKRKKSSAMSKKKKQTLEPVDYSLTSIDELLAAPVTRPDIQTVKEKVNLDLGTKVYDEISEMSVTTADELLKPKVIWLDGENNTPVGVITTK